MSDRTITISRPSELEDAFEQLARSGGGTIELEASGAPYTAYLEDRGDRRVDAPVRLTSADPDDPAVIADLTLLGRENVTVDNVVLDSTAITRGAHHRDLEVSGSDHVLIEDVVFSGGAEKGIDGASRDGQAADMALVRWSEDVTIRDSVVQGYYHGLSIMEADDVTVTGLDVSRMQGDVMRLAGAQDVLVADNYFHDMLGALNSINHSDMIQLWGTNIQQNNARITIRDNVMTTGDGPAYQMIFGGNDHRHLNGFRFEDIVVEGNVLHGSNRNMIRIDDTDGMVVRHNTVLWNHETGDEFGVGGNREGWIAAPGDDDAVIVGNIARQITGGTGRNEVVDYDDPNDPNYFARHFVNLEAGGTADLRDLSLKPDSPWDGRVGSPLTWSSHRVDAVAAVAEVERSPADLSVVTLSASLSEGPDGFLGDGARYTWTFDDGRTARGETVTHDFGEAGLREYSLRARAVDGGGVDVIERTIAIEDPLLLDLDLSGGRVRDTSSYDSPINLRQPVSSSAGFVLDGRSAIEVPRDAVQLHALDRFDLRLDFASDGGVYGTLFEIKNTIKGVVHADGGLAVTLWTAGGQETVSAGRGTLRDGVRHEIGVSYDGASLALEVDGTVEDREALTGTTAGVAHHGLVIGRQWQASAEGVLFDVSMSAELGSDEGAPPRSNPPPRGLNTIQDPVIADDDGPDGALLWLDFDGAIADEASGASVRALGGARLVEGRSGEAVAIGDGAKVEVSRSTSFLHERDSFAFSFDLQRDGAREDGRLLQLGRTMEAEVWADGTLRFTLHTDEGSFSARSAAGAISGGDWHDVEVGYDDARDLLSLRVDGERVDVEASGTTAPHLYWGLTLGTAWGDGLRGAIDEFRMADEAVWL